MIRKERRDGGEAREDKEREKREREQREPTLHYYSCQLFIINRPKLTLSMRVFGTRNSAYAFWPTTDMQNTSKEKSIRNICKN